MFFKVNDDERDNIERAVETLRMGGVVLYNTNTYRHWSLACDATNEVAVKKVIELKGGEIAPLDHLVIAQDEEMLHDFVCPIPGFITPFLHNQDDYVTVVYHKGGQLAPSACYEDGSVAVRIIPSVDDNGVQMSRHLMRLFGKPVYTTSCMVNNNNNIMPQTYDEVDERIRLGVGLVSPLVFAIDEEGHPSMIIKYDQQGHITVLRKSGERKFLDTDGDKQIGS